MPFPPWPPRRPFPESQRDTLGGNAPDFPGSSGDRERGKFRPSATPTLTTVAVVGDGGESLAPRTTEALLADVLLQQKAIVLGLSLLTGVDLLENVS